MSKSFLICCPKCSWEPHAGARWACTCGHEWNTFDTAALCPACNKQWTHTQCLSAAGDCYAMSPHLDWYRGLDKWLDTALRQVRTTKRKPAPASAE